MDVYVQALAAWFISVGIEQTCCYEPREGREFEQILVRPLCGSQQTALFVFEQLANLLD